MPFETNEKLPYYGSFPSVWVSILGDLGVVVGTHVGQLLYKYGPKKSFLGLVTHPLSKAFLGKQMGNYTADVWGHFGEL